MVDPADQSSIDPKPAIDRDRQQLLQFEKMASLGQLTAGIAHEINNPLAYCINNLAVLSDRFERLQRRWKVLECDRLIERSANAESLEACLAFIRSLSNISTFYDDVASFEKELNETAETDRVALISDFLKYVLAREEALASRTDVMNDIGALIVSTQNGLGRVKAIVLDLKTFSRLDEGQSASFNVDEGIASTLAMIEHLANDKKVTLIHKRGLSSNYTCQGHRLNQVILNLTTNAISATPSGGQVIIETSETALGPLIQVSDTGGGIAPEHRDRIFEPFFTTKPRGEGTGLGLSISLQIVEDHGGTLSVESTPGVGTTMIVQLPPREAAAVGP